MDEMKDELKDLVISPAWKYLVQKLKEKQQGWKDLAFETNPKSEHGVNNILSYQAMSNAVDALFEEVDDVVRNAK